MTVRFANNQQIIANHYNPDLMTAPADISVNGGPTFHVNFGNTFSWNQFFNLTIPVQLRAGVNTIRFIANPQYNYDSTTIGIIYSGDGVGQPLRSETAPNIDQITLAPFQLPGRRPGSRLERRFAGHPAPQGGRRRRLGGRSRAPLGQLDHAGLDQVEPGEESGHLGSSRAPAGRRAAGR